MRTVAGDPQAGSSHNPGDHHRGRGLPRRAAGRMARRADSACTRDVVRRCGTPTHGDLTSLANGWYGSQNFVSRTQPFLELRPWDGTRVRGTTTTGVIASGNLTRPSHYLGHLSANARKEDHP
jgi:hypothetical protein